MQNMKRLMFGMLVSVMCVGGVASAYEPTAEWTTDRYGLEELNGVWGSGPNDVYVVGQVCAEMSKPTIGSTDEPTSKPVNEGGLIRHFNGVTWTSSIVGVWRLNAVWGSGTSFVLAVGDDSAIYRSTDGGVTWTLSNTGVPEFAILSGVWGTDENNVYVAGRTEYGESLVVRSTDGGATWVVNEPVCYSESGALSSLWGSGANDICVVSCGGDVLRTTDEGATWTVTSVTDGSGLVAIWGTASDNIYVVGSCGAIYRYNGADWLPAYAADPNMPIYETYTGVWGSSANDVYVVGNWGSVRHFDGTTWSDVAVGTEMNDCLNGVWGSASDDVYVVGTSSFYSGYGKRRSAKLESDGPSQEGMILHYWLSATLNASTTPVDGEVFVDGVSVGTGSYSGTVRVGEHVVSFGEVDGYVAPAMQAVEVTAGETTTVVGTYKGRGVLKISTTPVAGEILIDGASLGTGSVELSMPVGEYTVTFGAVEDYTTPASQTVAVTVGETTAVVGTYEEDVDPAPGDEVGTLAISTTPVNGEIFIDGVSVGTGSANRELAVGEYTVSFGDMEGYVTPADQTIAVTVDEETTVVGTYVLEDWLQKLVATHGCLALGGVCTALMLFGFFGLAMPKQ